MGLLDSLAPAYDPHPVRIDAATSSMIDKSGQDALISKEDLARNAMAGTANTDFLAGAKGPGNVAMSGALQNKYEKLAGEQMNALGFQQSQLATVNKSQRLQQSANMAMARQRVAQENYARMVSAYNNQVAARAQVLSSFLGLGGMAAGFAFGGPAGAAAGGMAGQQAGKKMAPKPIAAPNYDDNSYTGGGGGSMNYAE